VNAALDILRELYATSNDTRAPRYDWELRDRIKAVLDAYDAGEPWPNASPAFQAEKPWCGWTLAFAHGTDWDTTVFGLERLLNISVLLTTSDGRSRPVTILAWQCIDPVYAASTELNRDCDRKAGIVVRELETEHYEPQGPEELIPYEDIREIVVY
jgi:hypothetical protein